MRRVLMATMGLVMLSFVVVPAIAQEEEEPRVTVDFNGETLNQVLQMFKRVYGLEYTIGEGVDPEMRITTYLREVTVEQAL